MSSFSRYTKIYFGENQLSLGSFGILPLTSNHLNPLLRIRVRASPCLSTRITLFKVSSPSFGSNDCNEIAQLGHAFTPPPQVNLVRLGTKNNSPVHSSIGTTLPLAGLRLLDSQQFQFYFIPLPGCFSPFPRGTSSLSVDIGI